MSYSYDMSGLDLFADPFRSTQISRTQASGQGVSSQKAKTPTMQPKAQSTAMQQPKTRDSAVPQPENPQPRATPEQKPAVPVKPATPVKPPVTAVKSSAIQAETENDPAPSEKPQTETTPNTVQEEKQPPVDTQPAIQKKDLVLDMSEDTAISDKLPAVSDDDRRKAHEAAEAKRKAEWDAKQRAKKQAEEAVIQKLQEMSDSDVVSASTERISADVERITRRNMKECVSDHIQSLCRKDPAFARLTMHPRKNMSNCFKYINRMAKDFILQEMEENGIKKDSGGYGSDIPDGLCYQWAEDYFRSTDVKEDQEKEEKFVSQPYTGSSKTASKAKAAKKSEQMQKKEPKKNQEPSNGYEQMTLGV